MADRYWRGGAGTWNTTSTTNWSISSNGSGGASVPTAADNVIFDQAGTYTVTMTGALACLSITVSAGTVTFATGTTPTLAISGGMSLIAGTVWSSTGAITFNSTTTQTITTNAVTINGAITFNGVGGNWSLGSALTTGLTLTTTLTAGTLTLNGFNLTTGVFSSSVTNTRAIAFGTNNIVLSHATAATVVLSMATLTGFTYTGTGGFSVAAMSNTRTFTCGTTGGTTTNAPNLTFTTGASVATITTASWFNKLDYGTTSFTQAASTLNVNSITLSSTGTYTALILNLVGTGTVTYNGKTTAAVTLLAGTPTIADTVTCTTFTVNGPTFNFTSGTINPSTSFVVTSGGFTLNGGTLGAVPTFTHTAGAVTFNASYTMTVTSTYTLTAGTLTLADGVILSTGIFSSTNTNTRTINFGLTTSPGYIALTHTTAATVVLNIAIMTGLTVNAKGKWDGTTASPAQVAGGFRSETTVTRTFTCGTTGGNSANAPCLYVTGTGATQLPTFTTASWFGDFNIGNLFTMTIAATTLNINSLLGQGYYYSLNTTSMNINFVGSGFINYSGDTNNTFGILGAVTINHAGTTAMVYDYCAATTVALTAGTLECRFWSNGPFNGYGSFKLTGAFTQTGGSWYNNAIYIPNCTTYTVNGPTISFDSGSITATTSMVLTTGSFTFNGGTTSAVPLFTHTNGTATFNYNYSLAVTGTYTLTAGTLTLANGVTLNTGIFSSTGAGIRSIAFGSTSAGNINLTHTTAATVVLNMAALGGFSYTGTGGFTVADMANTRTFSVGNTSGGSTTTAPNLTFTTGASVATLTTASWYNNLDFGTTSFTLGTTSLNIDGDLTLSSSGTYTGLTASILGTGTVTTNAKTIVALIIGSATLAGTATLAGAVTLSGALTLTQGSLTCSTYNVQSATFASTGALTRTMTGSGTYTITGSGATAFSNASTGITITGLIISMTAATAKTFAGGGGSYSTLNQGGAGALTISGSNSFADLTATTRPSTITFTISTTQTFAAFTLSGTAGNLVTINSSSAGTQATLSKSSGAVSVGYLSIRDSNATGGATWQAGATSTNVSNNTGWVFGGVIYTAGGLFFAFF